jgi:hypothetical protein
MLGIPLRGTKIEANFWNFVEENTISILFSGTGNFRFESLSQIKVLRFSVKVVDPDPVGSASFFRVRIRVVIGIQGICSTKHGNHKFKK